MLNLRKKAFGYPLVFALATGLGFAGTTLSVLAEDTGAVIEEIVVTGSRLSRTNAFFHANDGTGTQ